jgi:hypothetical protein
MSYVAIGVGLVVGLFVAMVALLEAGRRIGLRRPPPTDEAGKVGIAAVDGAVFGLMGLLLAFSFSGALSRWDTRRGHIAGEVNEIGTAYLRLDLLPESAQPAIQQSFRDYVDARMATYAHVDDRQALTADRARTDSIQADIWKRALAACRESADPSTRMLVLTSLNQMFDSATTRDLYAVAHPPAVIYGILAAAVLASSLLAGYGMAGSMKANRLHMICYALMITLTVYVTLEIEFPRVGLIRIDAADAAFVDMRAGMK